MLRFSPNMRAVVYKGGVTLIDEPNPPTHQCTSCFKPWWPTHLPEAPMLATCPNCGAALREVTEAEPLITA